MTFPSVVSQTADTFIGLFPDDAIAIFDRDFRVLRVGGRGVTLLGLDVEAIAGLALADALLSRADAAMYQAKAAGRNQAVTYAVPDVVLLGAADPALIPI